MLFKMCEISAVEAFWTRWTDVCLFVCCLCLSQFVYLLPRKVFAFTFIHSHVSTLLIWELLLAAEQPHWNNACCKSALLEGTVAVVTKGGLNIPWSLYFPPTLSRESNQWLWTVTTLLLPPSILLWPTSHESSVFPLIVKSVIFIFARMLWFWSGDASAMKLSTSTDIFISIVLLFFNLLIMDSWDGRLVASVRLRLLSSARCQFWDVTVWLCCCRWNCCAVKFDRNSES